MKIRGEILEVQSIGDQLALLIQGTEDGAAEWRSMSTIRLRGADNNARRRRGLYVGRKVVITIGTKEK